mgnify:CR=1 FL=1
MGLGDDLMVTGEARNAFIKVNRKIAVMLDRKRQRWSEVFKNNPYMATPSEVRSGAKVFWLGPDAGRRYMIKQDLHRRYWTNIGPTVGQLFFTDEERNYAKAEKERLGDNIVFIEPNIKSIASPNKDWGWDRWRTLVNLLPNVNWVQIAKSGYKILPGVSNVVNPPSFRKAAALLSHSDLCVLPEGGLHHACAVVNKKAIVIFGGYISPVQTGYPIHVNIFTGGTPCGMKTRCAHCKDAMNKITPEIIRDWVLSLI